MKCKPTYAGKIQNTGNQHIAAVFTPHETKAAKIREGKDLRGGNNKKAGR